MNILIIQHGSELDKSLETDWDHDNTSWIDFVKTFPGVIDADGITDDSWPGTKLTFESEEHKNWFLLKYS